MTDCPDAAKEIEQNVKEARKEMKREASNDRNQCDDYNDLEIVSRCAASLLE
jgi:hypothetical protein